VFWQGTTIGLLILGYAGYYLCRSDLSVALPLIINEMAARGVGADVVKIRFGWIASLGVLAYAIGKFPSGAIADFQGGRRNFLAGMAGSVIFTVLFALGGGVPLFTLAWIGNRLVQSLGWAGVVKISSKWFSFESYGTVMGLVSLSFLFGDAAARQFMAFLIDQGLGWRGIFLAAAGVMLALLALNFALLKESPVEIGQPEPPSNPLNLFGEQGNKTAPASLRDLLAPFLRSRIFWLVCLLSLGFTLLRETFNLWTPTYFTQVIGLSGAEAARKSSLFPLFGGISVLLSGFLSDRVGRGGRAAIIFCGLVLAGIVLVFLGNADFHASKQWPVWLVALVAFLLIGPYSYLAGAISLDFGGKQGSATASGFIDGVGYLGGVLAGENMARISVAYGWQGAFFVMAAVAWTLGIAAAVYWADQARARTAEAAGAGARG
jgi:sugar phosphate permease